MVRRPIARQTAPAVPGEVRMRRVWLRAEPDGKTNNAARHWYVDARSREGAINHMARALRWKAELFDSECY